MGYLLTVHCFITFKYKYQKVLKSVLSQKTLNFIFIYFIPFLFFSLFFHITLSTNEFFTYFSDIFTLSPISLFSQIFLILIHLFVNFSVPSTFLFSFIIYYLINYLFFPLSFFFQFYHAFFLIHYFSFQFFFLINSSAFLFFCLFLIHFLLF